MVADRQHNSKQIISHQRVTFGTENLQNPHRAFINNTLMSLDYSASNQFPRSEPEIDPLTGEKINAARGQRPIPQAWVIITSGPHEGLEIRLTQVVIFGRATTRATWDIKLQDAAISRPHAEIRWSNMGWFITDYTSHTVHL